MKEQSKSRMTRPFVLINMAMTADGKIATANRRVHSFSSARDREHLHELRATADAVLCGARTVEISRATLETGGERFRKLRLKRGLAEYPLRVVVSGSGSIHPQSQIFKKHFSPVVILTTARAPRTGLARLRAMADEVKICGRREINFAAALHWLRTQWGVRRLLCEGGGELNDALFRAGLVDELHLTLCPIIFGGRSAPTFSEGEGFPRLERLAALQLHSCQRLGNEVFAVFRRRPNS